MSDSRKIVVTITESHTFDSLEDLYKYAEHLLRVKEIEKRITVQEAESGGPSLQDYLY